MDIYVQLSGHKGRKNGVVTRLFFFSSYVFSERSERGEKVAEVTKSKRGVGAVAEPELAITREALRGID